MIVPIVLAAGESKRIGSPKALLRVDGQPFIRRIIDVLKEAGLENIIVVLGAFSDVIRKELDGLEVFVVLNREYRRGQLSSLLKGIEVARGFDPEGILVHPVDHPFVSAGLVRCLVRNFQTGRFLVVLPVYRGKRGHPVVFSSQLLGELGNAAPALGARAVVWQHRRQTCEVKTRQWGCVADIDTLQDYTDYLRWMHQRHR